MQLNPSLLLANLLLVHALLGILSDLEAFKENESRSSSLSVSLLDVDLLISNLTISIEELDDFISLDSEWETIHDKSSILVVWTNKVGELDVGTTLVTSVAIVGWTSVESGIVSIGDEAEFNISGANVLALLLGHSFLSFLLILEKNCSESVLSSIVSESHDNGSLDVVEVLKELRDVIIHGRVWKSSDFDRHQVIITD